MTANGNDGKAASDVAFDKELAAIVDRRAAYGLPPTSDQSPACGLALSGGGIRSATFGLGVLRGLSSAGVLHKIDYLSTVSGGGYIGAFYCGLFAQREGLEGIIAVPSNDKDLPAGAGAFDDKDLLAGAGALRSIAYLRQAGRFLAPGGGRDLIYAVALLMRNWLALSLVVGIAIVFGELVIDGSRYLGAMVFESTRFATPSIWLSPLLTALVVAVVLALASAWAYWLSLRSLYGPDDAKLVVSPPLLGTVLIIAAAGWTLTPYGKIWLAGLALPWLPSGGALLIVVVATLALIINALAIWFEHGSASLLVCWRSLYRRLQPKEFKELFRRDDRVRHRLSIWQGYLAVAALACLALSLADSASFLLLWAISKTSVKGGLWALIYPALAPVAQKLLKWIDAQAKTAAPSPSGGSPGWLASLAGPLTALGALIFAALTVAVWGFAAHALVFGLPPSKFPTVWQSQWPNRASWGLIVAIVFVVLASLTSGFINFSSLASFYADRLRSAYLGASNSIRVGQGAERGLSVYAVNAADDLDLNHYYEGAGKRGAPVHIINVTINETQGKGPQTVQQDRHGINMAISPQGMIFNEMPGGDPVIKPLHNNKSDPSANVQKPGQRLPLSAWIGISGAAFSTGLGQGTSTPRSILAFLTNVRLGYWWRADRDKPNPAPTYINVVHELLASFPGTDAREWYLSDGGHFENTAVYELIRRKVSFIIVSDNGCDPHYIYDDLANLVRKARIDFRAEITFLNSTELDAKFVADSTLRSLFAHPHDFNKSAAATALAMLARVKYIEGNEGTLLVIKPKLNQWLPQDVASYAAAHKEFPQQTTLNQFFSEDQWESYEKLGWMITEQLFKAEINSEPWHPSYLRPLCHAPQLSSLI